MVKKKIIGTIFILSALLAGGLFGYVAVNGSALAYSAVKSEIYVLGNKERQTVNFSLSFLDSEKIEIIQGYNFKDNDNFPNVSAEAFLVADLESGDIIASRKEDKVFPIASITKLVTAITSLDLYKRGEVMTASFRAVDTFSESGDIKVGKGYLFEDLLHALLLESSNDVSEVLAEHVDRDDFITLMNTNADIMDLNFTNFADPSGISPQNVSNTKDLFKLTKYIRDNYPGIFNITTEKDYSNGSQTWRNNSKFRSDEKHLGGKNGLTSQAGNTLVATFELALGAGGEKRDIAIILLKSDSPEKDTRGIIKYLEDNIVYH